MHLHNHQLYTQWIRRIKVLTSKSSATVTTQHQVALADSDALVWFRTRHQRLWILKFGLGQWILRWWWANCRLSEQRSALSTLGTLHELVYESCLRFFHLYTYSNNKVSIYYHFDSGVIFGVRVVKLRVGPILHLGLLEESVFQPLIKNHSRVPLLLNQVDTRSTIFCGLAFSYAFPGDLGRVVLVLLQARPETTKSTHI